MRTLPIRAQPEIGPPPDYAPFARPTLRGAPLLASPGIMMRHLLLASLLFSLACGDDDSTDPADMGPGLDIGTLADLSMPVEDMFAPTGDMGPPVECLDEVDDDTIENAQDLGDIQSNADFPAGTVMGDIDPVIDFDWYTYTVEDAITGDVQPRVSLAARPAGVIWELCMYYECDSGDTSFDCPAGTTEHTVGEVAGCCAVSSEGTPSITLGPGCSGTFSEDGTVFARVSRQGGVVTCEGYTLSWGDD